jgi:hypothetical protein
MFYFFHRSSIINIDCFTSNQYAYKYAPIIYAYSGKPDWFDTVEKPSGKSRYVSDDKGLRLEADNSYKTLSSCWSFQQLYRKGLIVENWCDFAMEVKENGLSWFHSNGAQPWIHQQFQTGKGFKDYHLVKLRTPWAIRTKENVDFMMTGTEWSLEDYSFKVLPGVLNFTYSTATNIFIAVSKKPNRFEIPAGQQLAHIVPLTDKKIKLHNHIVSEEELARLEYTAVGFSYGWRHLHKLVNRSARRQSECPFKKQ